MKFVGFIQFGREYYIKLHLYPFYAFAHCNVEMVLHGRRQGFSKLNPILGNYFREVIANITYIKFIICHESYVTIVRLI